MSASGVDCRIAVALAIGMLKSAVRKQVVVPISAATRTAATLRSAEASAETRATPRAKASAPTRIVANNPRTKIA